MSDAQRDALNRAVQDRFGDESLILADPAGWVAPPSDRSVDFQLGWWAALSMVVASGEQALTEFEHQIADRIAGLAGDFMVLVGDTETAEADFGEILPHLHALQMVVLAQAASRAHPGRYRSVGEHRDDTDPGG